MTFEQAAILIGFLLICYVHQQILDHADLKKRVQRFYATMISKKIFSWWVVTAMFIYERYAEEPHRGDWLIEYLSFTAAVFCIDVAQKYLGLQGKYASATSPTGMPLDGREEYVA